MQHRARLDVAGVALVGTALLALVIGLAAAQNGMLRPETWLPLAVSVVAAVLFVRHERREPRHRQNLPADARPAAARAGLAAAGREPFRAAAAHEIELLAALLTGRRFFFRIHRHGCVHK